MFPYITTVQAAEKWCISKRRVNELCVCGRISGAVFVGGHWLIPKNADKPFDGRTVLSRSRKDYGTFTKHK